MIQEAIAGREFTPALIFIVDQHPLAGWMANALISFLGQSIILVYELVLYMQ
jgi:hypothetical protein